MVEIIEAIVLGIVQGIAEFLPISSSGHLVICTELLNSMTGKEFDSESSLQMNVALHVGTLGSILVVYRNYIFELLRDPRRWITIIVATLPLVLLALTPMKDWLSSHSTPMVAGWCLLVTAMLLFLSARVSERAKQETVSVPSAFLIGCFQACALLPGISRSGATITGAMFTGVEKDAAARFSFLIAIPAILGASVLELKDYFTTTTAEAAEPIALLAGAAVSFIVGWFSLNWLLSIISRGKLHYFGWYCVCVGLLTIFWQFVVR